MKASGQELRRAAQPVARRDDWLTPPEIIRVLGPFDLDPCACSEPRPWPTAALHIARPDDGLHHPWEGRVWLNPPYHDAARWLARMAAHGNGIALIFARTDTRMFQEFVWNRASGLLFIRNRLSFHAPNGSVGVAGRSTASSVLVAYDRPPMAENYLTAAAIMNNVRLRDSGIAGTYVDSWVRTA